MLIMTLLIIVMKIMTKMHHVYHDSLCEHHENHDIT